MENKDIIELRKDTYDKARCCRNCKYCAIESNIHFCYLILDNESMVAVEPYNICAFYKVKELLNNENS